MSRPKHIRLPGLLLVSGTGRNSGKTTFIRELIEMHQAKQSLTAIKVSPHHHSCSEEDILIHDRHFQIMREQHRDTGKDSSIMLRAGAREVFYLQAMDQYLYDAFLQLMPLLNADDLYLCESGGLREYVVPDLFFIIHNSTNDNIKDSAQRLIPLADGFITRSQDKLDFDTGRIVVRKNRWALD